MHTFKKATTIAVTTLALLAGGIVGGTSASAGDICDPGVKRTYQQTRSKWWLIAASGTVSNPKAHEVREEISFEHSGTRKTTKSAEVSAGVRTVVGEINAKTSYSVDTSVTITKGHKTTIVVGKHETVHYKIGVKRRKFLVTQERTYSNCKVTTSYGTVTAADRTTETR